jgi:hypothetical protein
MASAYACHENLPFIPWKKQESFFYGFSLCSFPTRLLVCYILHLQGTYWLMLFPQLLPFIAHYTNSPGWSLVPLCLSLSPSLHSSDMTFSSASSNYCSPCFYLFSQVLSQVYIHTRFFHVGVTLLVTYSLLLLSFDLLFDFQNEGSIFHWNVGKLTPGYTESHPRTLYSSYVSVSLKQNFIFVKWWK